MTKLGQSPAATWLKRHTTRPPTAVPGAFWQSSYFAGNQGERGPAHACPGAPPRQGSELDAHAVRFSEQDHIRSLRHMWHDVAAAHRLPVAVNGAEHGR